jgi:hypothetical protein
MLSVSMNFRVVSSWIVHAKPASGMIVQIAEFMPLHKDNNKRRCRQDVELKSEIVFHRKLRGILGKQSRRAATKRVIESGGRDEGKFTNKNGRGQFAQYRPINRRRDFSGNGIELANKTNVSDLPAGGFLRLLAAGLGDSRLAVSGRGMAVGVLRKETHQQHNDHQAGCGKALEIFMHG